MNGKFWNYTYDLAFLSNGNAKKIIIIEISVGNWKNIYMQYLMGCWNKLWNILRKYLEVYYEAIKNKISVVLTPKSIWGKKREKFVFCE